MRLRLWHIVASYVAALGAVAVLLCGFADVIWPGTLLAFGPRWIWGVPLAGLVPVALVRDRRLLVPLAAAIAVYLGPVLDLRVPVHGLLGRGAPPSRDLRVMTYNIGGGEVSGDALRALVRDVGPDVVALQERSVSLTGAGPPSMPYSGSEGGEQGLYSRFPIVATDARDRADLLARHGGGSIVRYELSTPRGPLQVVNVHLATVRDGLSSVMRRRWWRGLPALDANTRERALESEIARAWANRGTGPRVVVGDFNIPVESAIYRRSWGSYENALSQAGHGLVSTKHTRWHGVRIDHVLAGPGWRVLSAWVGPGLGGDHRPVIADLAWVGGL